MRLETVIPPQYHPSICIRFEPSNTVFNQTYSTLAQAQRSGAVSACAAAGLWCMSAMMQPRAAQINVINYGKSRAHRVQVIKA